MASPPLRRLSVLDAPPGRSWLVWGLTFATWIVVWAAMVGQGFVHFHGRGEAVPWVRYWGMLADFLLLALFTPWALALIWRAPLRRETWRRSLRIQILAGVAVTTVYTLVDLLVRRV